MKKTRLEKLLEDKDFPVIDAIISYLRGASPKPVSTGELTYVTRRSNVYGLIKKGREYLALTTQEFIPNIPKRKNRVLHGYTVTKALRPALYEADKSFDRAEGHAFAGIKMHARIARKEMTTPQDVELWLAINARARAAKLLIEASKDAREVVNRSPDNKRLSEAARNDTAMPWETLGLEDHTKQDSDD